MPLGLKFPPLFARSKTTSSINTSSSDPSSGVNTASSSTILNSPSLSDLKKSTSILHRRRNHSKQSHDRAQSVPAEEKPRSPSSITAGFGVDSSVLGSVGEEQEEQEESADIINNGDAAGMSQTKPELLLQEATPPPQPTGEGGSYLAPHLTEAQTPAGLDALLNPRRPSTADGASVHESIGWKSSNASPKHISRRPSLVDSANVTSLIHSTPSKTVKSNMPRKIWVKRPGASATLVQVREDDLVDDVREMILRKYANSLGKTFDAPDMTLRIVARGEQTSTAAPRPERTLGPEEEICHTIDMAYPGGQSVDEALVIDVPMRRTPKPSPRAFHHQQLQQQAYQNMDDYRPVESGTDYFPPMPALQAMLPATAAGNFTNYHFQHPATSLAAPEHQRSMAVLTTGQLPPIPSPGSSTARRSHHRPKFTRGNTSSPTIVQHSGSQGIPHTGVPANMVLYRASTRPRVDSSALETHHVVNGLPPPPPPALPTPPAPEVSQAAKGLTPPTPSGTVAALNPSRLLRPKKGRKSTPDKSLLGRGPRSSRRGSQGSPAQLGLPPITNMLEGIVPPINILIVEDNTLILRVLQGIMKRLRVRWDSAVNGQIAVDKWRKGGYHLILMDIQMPVMNGLEATKEIRRLEKVNGIGVFSSSAPSSPEEIRVHRKQDAEDGVDSIDGATTADAEEAETPAKRKAAADKLVITEGIFKSPIIIVALTASSLQSDRHEALAAGCNDFLTKPVHLPWLERKVKEWGCMQALIDFDGWKRWRDINEKEEAGKSDKQKAKERELDEKHKQKMAKEDEESANTKKKIKAANRASVDGGAVAAAVSPTVNGYANGH